MDITIEEYKAQFRLTGEEADPLAVLLEERDTLQDQVDENLDGIRNLVGPGVHRLDAKRLSRQYDLSEEETARLETLIDEWTRLSKEQQDKTKETKETMDFLATIGVVQAR